MSSPTKVQKIITPAGRSFVTKAKELMDHRELVGLLAWRDFRVRYAQTFVGVTWAFFNPLVNLLILSFVFNRVAGVGTQGTPPLLYAAAGILGWTFFAEAASRAGESLMGNQNMVRKIYFPRLALPASAVVASLPDLVVSLLLVLLMLLIQTWWAPSQLYGLIFLFPLLILTAFTAGTWISALTIRFRDFRFVVPVLLRLGLFAVPIAYPLSQIPAQWQGIYCLNPLVGLIEGFKWSLLGLPAPSPVVWLGLPVLITLFITGLYLFHRVERYAADHL
ncbi:phosphate ABC transporter permease [Lewinellaceae bacterium SD302]|nr:phosphate ABC transporter permease [Lewinellaceae bacterium SD302]